MQTGDTKPVSDVPLEARQPQRGAARGLLTTFVLGILVAGVLGVVWFWVLPQRGKPRQQPSEPHEWQYQYDGTSRRDPRDALATMRTVADALLAYRDTQGGGLRWPNALHDLTYAGLIDADFDFVGDLSGAQLAYRPDMPLGHDPSRWVVVHDTEIGWVRPQGSYRRVKGILSAVVMLGDGSVKVIDGQDVELYGGLALGPEAAR